MQIGSNLLKLIDLRSPMLTHWRLLKRIDLSLQTLIDSNLLKPIRLSLQMQTGWSLPKQTGYYLLKLTLDLA